MFLARFSLNSALAFLTWLLAAGTVPVLVSTLSRLSFWCFKFFQELLVNPCRCHSVFKSLTSSSLGYVVPALEGGYPSISASLFGSLFALSHGKSMKSRAVNSLCTLLIALRVFMATAAQAYLDCHIPLQSFSVGENKFQHSTSPVWFLYDLEKDLVISALQEPPGLSVPCYILSPPDTGVVVFIYLCSS